MVLEDDGGSGALGAKRGVHPAISVDLDHEDVVFVIFEEKLQVGVNDVVWELTDEEYCFSELVLCVHLFFLFCV